MFLDIPFLCGNALCFGASSPWPLKSWWGNILRQGALEETLGPLSILPRDPPASAARLGLIAASVATRWAVGSVH